MFDRHGLLACWLDVFLHLSVRCCQPWQEFRFAKPPFPVFQLVKRIAVGSVVTSFGYALSMIPFVKRHEIR